MFRWMLMVKKLFSAPPPQRLYSKGQAFKWRFRGSHKRGSRRVVKPNLEVLEDLTLPSTSALTPDMFVTLASPPPVPSMTAITSYASSIMNQWSQLLAAVQQDVSSAFQTLGQEFAQEASSMQQQWDNLLGINPTPPNPSVNTAVTRPSSEIGAGRGNSSGSGSGTGAITSGHNSANPTLSNTSHQSGSGSGSGSSASAAHESATLQGSRKTQPMGGGTGSSGSGTSGSGTGSVGGFGSYGYANVSGEVWLDNNGDGYQDNYELGYSGITVDLYDVSSPQWTLKGSTKTDEDGRYLFQNIVVGGNPEPYLVHVDFGSAPASLYATYHTSDNMINNNGNSSIFQLAIGGWRKIKAGLLSMIVTTTADDPNAPIQNQITLRDAIQTGNNGGGPLGLKLITFYDFLNNKPLSGTISLQKALDPIKRSYVISGPGSATLVVSGQLQVNVFTVEATAAISGLTISSGNAFSGSGIYNFGALTLNSVILFNNEAGAGGGGAIFNTGGATLNMSGVIVSYNSATGMGGGILNHGELNCSGCQIMYNEANGGAGNGGGIANVGGDTHFDDKTQISGNTASGYGGGIYENGGKVSSSTLGLSGGDTVGSNSASIGGGIYVYTGALDFTARTVWSNNKATGGGGGIEIMFGTAKLSNGMIQDNSALNGTGGGIQIFGGHLTLNDEIVSYNSANVNGGGIALGGSETKAGGTVVVSGGSIQANTAGNSGGGIYNVAGALLLGLNNNEVAVNDNDATNQGGGLYLATPSSTTFNGCLVSGNGANTGNGVYWQNNAKVFPNPPTPPQLVDDDDPGGNPVRGN